MFVLRNFQTDNYDTSSRGNCMYTGMGGLVNEYNMGGGLRSDCVFTAPKLMLAKLVDSSLHVLKNIRMMLGDRTKTRSSF